MATNTAYNNQPPGCSNFVKRNVIETHFSLNTWIIPRENVTSVLSSAMHVHWEMYLEA